MSVSDDLVPILKKLRLSGILQTLDLRTMEAVDASLSHSEFLFRLCSDEVERRESKQLDLRMRRAAFDGVKMPWCIIPKHAYRSLGLYFDQPTIWPFGLPSASIVFRILQPIRASTLCDASPLARIAEPMMAL